MLTLAQLRPFYQNPARSVREHVWRLASARQLADRRALNTVWGNLLPLRQLMAANAACSDYRA